ncbi:hypothetical protein ACWEKR_11105 [Nocardia sp. NPDC004573]
MTMRAAAQRPRDNAAIGKIVLSFADAHTWPHPAPDPVATIELCDRALAAGFTVGQEGRTESGRGDSGRQQPDPGHRRRPSSETVGRS